MGSASPATHPTLRRLRALSARLPETAEVEAWGHPTFRVGKKIFAAFEGYDDGPVVCCKQALADQAALVTNPAFAVAPYVGKHGWITARADLDWPVLEDLVLRSYRLVANKRQLAALD